MTSVGAYEIKAVTGSVLTEDGQFMLLEVEQPDGNQVVLAFPRDQLFGLLDMTAVSITEASACDGSPADETMAFNSSRLEVGTDPEGGSPVLSVTFGSGGVLSFQMAPSSARRMLEALSAVLNPEALPPQTHDPDLHGLRS